MNDEKSETKEFQYMLKAYVVCCLYMGTSIFVIGLISIIFEKGLNIFVVIAGGLLVGLLSALCYTGTIPVKVSLPLFVLCVFLMISGKDARIGYPAWLAGTLFFGTILSVFMDKILPDKSGFKKAVNIQMSIKNENE